ncbi:MAG TPA: histidine kinase [Bryobacterales bacterium]|nr:histidine kinase [Bryobacterales bacterium]
MRTYWRKGALIFAIWTVYGALNALQEHHRAAVWGHLFSWTQALTAEMGYAWLWALAMPAILWLGNRFPLTESRWRVSTGVHVAAAVLLAAGTKWVWDLLLLPFVAPDKAPATFVQSAKSILNSMDFGLLQYGLVLMCQQAWNYHRRYQEGQMRTSLLEAQLAKAQLQALKMQLHPHFLFNSLHAISELVHEDPDAAERMIARLSEFLRLTLAHVGVQEVTLSEELDFLKSYLEIEKMRFEERLKIDFRIDPATLGAWVPNLILQPLVENALRHGLARRAGDAMLRIESSRRDGALSMKVFDDGPGLETSEPGKTPEGVGPRHHAGAAGTAVRSRAPPGVM